MTAIFDTTTRFETQGYTIKCEDGRNWTVSQEVQRTKRGSEETYADEEILAYYGAPEYAVLEVWRRCSKKSSATSLKAFHDDVARMRTDILAAAKEFGWEAAGK